MQRPGSEPVLRAGSKKGKHRNGSAARSVAVGALLAAVLLFGALLLYSAHSFWHFSSFEHGALQVSGGGGGADDRQQLGDEGSLTYSAAAADVAAAAAVAGAREEGRGHRSGWLSAAILWAEEHHQQRLKEKASVYQVPTGCGLLPCQSQQLQRPPTLVVYVYAAVDSEEQKNFDFFMRHGVEQQDWLTFRIVIASGAGLLAPASLPELPPNAKYVQTSGCTHGTWGILAAVAQHLEKELEAAQRIVVVGSAARGPFMPPYTKQFMHWTDAFTSKLTKRTKLVGSALTCEGAPKGGDAAGEWRMNPFVLPYAWATDKEGWQLLSGTADVFRCYTSPWDARYFSDSGAALTLLTAGFNIDSLLTKYQGIDWWNQRGWDCNGRVRPDAEWTYDGISISPYETVFVPVSQGPLQNEWSYVRQAAKYSQWIEAQTATTPQGNPNAFISEAWTLRAQRMVYVNSRGPGCFDFDYYVKNNADMVSKAGMHQLLWEHFVLVGQFQGRPHRFTCPLQIGNSYKQAYVRARGRRCFDHNHYSKNNMDVRFAGISEAYELFNHYADFGQFEKRAAKFVCQDSMFGLPSGYDTRKLEPLPTSASQKRQEKWQSLVQQASAEAEAGAQKLTQQQQQPQGQAAAAAGGQQQAAEAAAGGAAAARGTQQAEQQQAQAAAAQQGVQQAQQQGATAAAAQGDVAADADAFGRSQASQAEAFQREEQLQQAAGGGQQA